MISPPAAPPLMPEPIGPPREGAGSACAAADVPADSISYHIIAIIVTIVYCSIL